MSDQEIRALERQAQADPADTDAQVKLFAARRRTGVTCESTFQIRNIKSGKYIQSWYQGHAEIMKANRSEKNLVLREATLSFVSATGQGRYSTREAILKDIKRLQKAGLDLASYQIVELQTMTLETPGPTLIDIVDQIDVELLQARKEAQLKKLQKIEVEEKALLQERMLTEQAKLKKLEAAVEKKEASLKKKLKGSADV